METNSLKTEKNSKVIITNLNYIQLCGVNKVFSATENCISICLAGCNMVLEGKNLHVKKLDIESEILEVDGQFYCFKMEKSKQEKNFFKRIFS